MSIQNIKVFLLLSFLLGLIPAFSFIHIVAKDFEGYYILAESFLKYHAYSFWQVEQYNGNLINTGLAARAPLLPLILALSIKIFGHTLFAIYLPFFLCRLLLLPFIYLVTIYFFSPPIAFLVSCSVFFFPKLQTFSLSALEADCFVTLFYLIILHLYFSYKKSQKKSFLITCGAMLGFLTLIKETGFPLSIGIICSIILESLLKLPKKGYRFIKQTLGTFNYLIIPFLIIVLPFFAYSIFKSGFLYFNAFTNDKSLKYMIENLPFLIKTIPMYLGLEELTLRGTSLKSSLLNFLILFSLLGGLFYALKQKMFVLVLPPVLVILALSLVNNSSLGGKIAGNFELITILPFMMPIVGILTFKGFLLLTNFIMSITGKFSFKKYCLISYVCCLLLTIKFFNNFFAKPYALDFKGNEYYINMMSIIRDNQKLPSVSFYQDANKDFIVRETEIIKYLKANYKQYKITVFTHQLKVILFISLSIGFVYGFLSFVTQKNNKYKELC